MNNSSKTTFESLEAGIPPYVMPIDITPLALRPPRHAILFASRLMTSRLCCVPACQ